MAEAEAAGGTPVKGTSAGEQCTPADSTARGIPFPAAGPN